jgi:UDP-N-acetylmuramate: L-alanyl-gamma-D-glutamyl-meso-diaminopimelate ligase
MIAVCGMGMAPLAGLLKEKGYELTGSDAAFYPPMSDQLTALGIPVKVGYRAENIENPDLVIVGNAVSKTNEEVQAVLAKRIPMMSMPEAIEKLFLPGKISLVVAGTHGKTTTSALLAWLLEQSGQKPGFLVGGVLKNFGRSYQVGSGKYFVLEGDEYDSAFFDKGPKFLHYHPQILILNDVEFDHADIYRDLDHLMAAFSQLISLMTKDGLIVASGDHPNVQKLIAQATCRVITFGLENHADLKAERLEFGEMTTFDLVRGGNKIVRIASPLVGRHNVKNLLGVLGALMELGIPLSEINDPLAGFQGVKRRQETLGTVRGITVIDDFAHHPTAVFETLTALRSKYGSRRLWAIFEPRSNTTRRKIFQKDFVGAFDPADQIIIAPPYLPEKIPPEERLDPEQLIGDLKQAGKEARYLPSIDAIVAALGAEAASGDILCFMSNGEFGGIHQKVLQKLRKT